MTTKDFIDTVFIHQLGEIVVSHPYIAFMIMGTGIELLGKCMYADSFNEEGVSRRRFEEAINGLNSFSRYKGLIGRNSSYDLYGSLRCGLAHAAVPKYPITLSSKEEMTHLHEHANGTRINLRCEDFYNDFKEAWEELKGMSGSVQIKLNQPFLSVPSSRIDTF